MVNKGVLVAAGVHRANSRLVLWFLEVDEVPHDHGGQQHHLVINGGLRWEMEDIVVVVGGE